MDGCIYISSSDDDLEEIDDQGRTLPQWATTTVKSLDNGGWSRRDSFSRGANSSNPSSSNVYNHSQVKPQTPPVSSTNTLNHRIARRDEPSYHAQNGNTSQHQTVNSRISNNHGADYEKMSSQQAFKRTLQSSLQPSATRALPSSFAPDSRLRNLKDSTNSSQLHDAYKNRPHGVGPNTSSDRGYIHENFGRGYDEDRFLYQNGGNRILPSPLMLGKAISPQFATSSESAYRAGAGDERAAESDERLIYEAALQDISQPKTEYDLPAGVLSVSLLRHQKIALAWMLQKETKSLHCLGGILADDQGLGKTISMISLILAQRSLQSKSKIDDTCSHKTEALNLDDDDDNGSVDVEKHKNSEESDDIKPSREPSSSTQAPGRKRPAAGTLVVCPASVLRQWARELDEKVGDEKLSVLVYHGGSRTKDPVELAKFDVVLTTYSIVTNEVPKQPLVEDDDIDGKNGERFGLSSEFSVSKKRKKPFNGNKKSKKGGKGIDSSSIECGSGPLAKVGWFRVILDEAQTIKNHRTQVARACCSLRAKRRWCLSGTPIQNTIDDLYSYFRFLKYDPYAVYKSFYNTIKVPISKSTIQGYKKLQAVLRAIMLRRTKGTLLDGKPIINLPPKTIELSKVDFSIEERAFYTKLESDSRLQFKAYAAAGTVSQNYANILLMLLRLRQACDHPLLVKDFDSDPVGKDSVEMAKNLPRDMLINLFNCLEATFAICLVCNDPPEEPVITMCGHVFCYQCVSEYLTGDDNMCPSVNCKELIGDDLVFSKATLRSCISAKPLPKSLRLPHSHIHIEVKLALKMEGRDEDVRVGANRYGERQPIGTAAQTQDAKDYREAPPAPLFEPRELTSWSFYRAGIAEFVATFLFLYVTVLTVMGVAKSPSKCSTVGVQGIAWSFGGMIFALVYCTAGISGGHINPAVTFGLFLARKLSLTRTVFYMIMQCLGAICGAAVVKGFQSNQYERLGGGANTLSKGYSKGDGLGAEIVGTFILVYTVFSATDAKRNARDSHVPILAPLPIGFAVFLVHLATIPITGTGINPARSLGAALVYNKDQAWDNHWIFWVGPFIGAALAALYHQIVLRAIPFKSK